QERQPPMVRHAKWRRAAPTLGAWYRSSGGTMAKRSGIRGYQERASTAVAAALRSDGPGRDAARVQMPIVRVTSMAMAMKTRLSVSASAVTWWAMPQPTSWVGHQCTLP